jgi:phosphoglycolate phosphatase
VYGSELDGTRAQKADLLAFAIERNPGADSHIMIGDRRHDLVGAIANDMTPIGAAWGYGSIDELTDAGAAIIAHAPSELGAVIARANASRSR